MLDDPQEPKFDAILLDHWLPGEEGTRADPPDPRPAPRSAACSILTAQNDVAVAVDAMRAGASDFIVKPLAPDRLLAALNTATDRRKRAGELRPLSEKIAKPLGFEEIVGSAPQFRTALAIAAKAARARVSVLIEGESGIGQGDRRPGDPRRLARAARSSCTPSIAARSRKISSNRCCSAMRRAPSPAPSTAISAASRMPTASTLFLDEVGELPLDTQVKLLRALETGEIQRVGSRITQTVDVRIIAATNRRLADEVAAGRFREDLYYRLNVVHVPIPPLRDRAERHPAARPPPARPDRRAARHAPAFDHRRRRSRC